ncbi:hypothetical protein [Haloparvum sedimenti]|uniref:hypothetical protein n=1 Tax=Haloparvum sedimenti TaxID=1678448 RepID=UPI00071E72E3|nr:hypothetical protein [Haloparvum sedimenti]
MASTDSASSDASSTRPSDGLAPGVRRDLVYLLTRAVATLGAILILGTAALAWPGAAATLVVLQLGALALGLSWLGQAVPEESDE